MSLDSDIGNLLCLPFDEIEPGRPTDVHDFLIEESAQLLRQVQRNWVPLIVKEIQRDQYQVVGNAFIYAAIAEAGLEEAWCILADGSPDTENLVATLTREVVPRINLSQASYQQISAALDFLTQQPETPLKGINIASAANRIDDAPRKYWTTLKPITKLKCKITAGKKLKALEQVFYLEPEPLPEVITDIKLLSVFTAAELKKMAKKRGLKGYSKLKKGDLIETLAMT